MKDFEIDFELNEKDEIETLDSPACIIGSYFFVSN